MQSLLKLSNWKTACITKIINAFMTKRKRTLKNSRLIKIALTVLRMPQVLLQLFNFVLHARVTGEITVVFLPREKPFSDPAFIKYP